MSPATVSVEAAAQAGGGAPLGQLAIIAAITTALSLLTIRTVLAYRHGGAPRLRRLESAVEGLVGLPGWAALPGGGAIVCALVIILGATWDIGLHIDVGRDDGPLGTLAHYPLLFGLFSAFICGILAIGLAPRDPRRSSSVAFRNRDLGAVPAASVLLLAGATFGMVAFPLDDLWHRMFGQDVTLWGPTHTMIIGGTLGVGIGAVLLLIEGARAAGRDPFRAKGLLARPLPALLAGVCLYLWAATTHEFNWGVPQYRMVWQPLILAFGASQALVLARVMGGRGAALGAIVVWLPIQAFMSVVIGGPLHVTMPSTPLFVAEAVVVELFALRGVSRHATAYGAAAGLGIGTIGFAAEYGWSQVAMPLPWTPSLLPEAIPVAILAGLAGGLLGSLMAQALRGTLRPGRTPLALALGAGAVVIALGVNASETSNPGGITATMRLSGIHQGRTPEHDELQRVGTVTVRFSDPSIATDAEWVTAMGWQGGGRYLDHLHENADGSWSSTTPVPLDGKWKSMVRVHSGRVMLSVPVRYPADPAIGFAGFPALAQTTRAMVPDVQIMQLERRKDAPMWAWKPATYLVLSTNLLMVLLIGLVSVRIGRMRGREATVTAPRGLITTISDEVLRHLGPLGRIGAA